MSISAKAGYDPDGRQIRVKSPDGTITRTVFDGLGRAVATYTGTNDDGATYTDPTGAHANANNNMVMVSAAVYYADGNLASSTLYVDDNPNNNRTTTYGYDWQNRPLWTMVNDGTYQTYTYSTYDNLGELVETQRFWDVDGDIPTVGPEIGTTAGCDKLLAQSTVDYDNLGRAYQTTTYAVDVSAIATSFPTVGAALTSKTWYDAAGNVIKSLSAGSNTFTKTLYDGLGRAVMQYVGYDINETTSELYDANGNVQLDLADDTIFEQSRIDYDAASNVVFATTYQRNHNATGTGELTTSTARASYAASWFDAVGWQTASANYGTNGGSAMNVGNRPATPPAVTSTDALVTKGEYVYVDANADGQVEYVTKTTTAASDGGQRVDWTVYDAAGRVAKTIQNYVDGDPATGASDEDVTVLTTYTPGGQVETYTVVNPSTGNQVTRYYYGTTLADSDVARGDLLRAVMYPDSDDTHSAGAFGNGQNGVYDRVEYKYNRVGEQTQVKDQNQTIHDFIFDALGRQASDVVTLPEDNPQNLDDSVLRIDMEYEIRGMINRVTSRDASNAVVNEIFRDCDAWGLLADEYQAHGGAVDTATTPHVQYKREDAANPTRLTGVVYPNGRELHYTYASGNDAAAGRVTSITDTDNTVLASYTYLGLGQVLAVSYPMPRVTYDLTHQDGNGQYDRLDQFGRVKNAIWTPTAGSALVDLRYGYDLAGNRIWRQDAAAGPSNKLDERYWYDSMSQLVDMQRGNLDFTDPSNPTIVGGQLSQQWDLDATGNWDTITTDGTPQDRDHNKANEMTGADGWAATAYDHAGNMTAMPQPNAPTQGYNLKWDAWNRLVTVTTGSGATEKTVAEYRYDGLNRRIVKKMFDAEGALLEARQFYLSDQNQVLEERVGTQTVADRQNVWGLRYIDDLVLRDWDSDRDGVTTDGSLGMTNSGLDERLYAMQDANYNVVAIASATGEVVERYTFTAYGKCEVRMNTFAPDNDGKSNFDWRSLYTTREFDPETGMYYYRARYYYAEMGRFVGRDPIGYWAKDANLYRYVTNRPTGRLDPSGTIDGAGGGEPAGWCGKPNCRPGYEPPGGTWLPNPNAPPPPPAPTPARGGNAKRSGGLGYFFASCCTSKKDRLSPIPGVVTPPTSPIQGTGPWGGNYEIYPFPSTRPAAVGGGGAGPCNILVVKGPGFVGVFHFSVGDSPSSTLGKFTWPAGCSAIICGGDDGDQSNCLGDDVKSAAKAAGLNVVGVSGNSGCGVDANGNWYQYGN